MISLRSVIDAVEPVEDGFRCQVPENWLQGRTAYGGFSTALALHAAQQCEGDLPPLQSAQIAFVGPLAGDVRITATLLRRGRNAAFVRAEVSSSLGIGLSATFVFMAASQSRLDHRAGETPGCCMPAVDAPVSRGIPAIAFTQNFEMVDCPAPDNAWLRWIRLAERGGIDPAVELMAIADCLPPAALKLLGGFVPISSMTWQLNLLGDPPATRDGWWLLGASTDHAYGGTSSQRMTLWNADRVLAAEHIQSIAIFA